MVSNIQPREVGGKDGCNLNVVWKTSGLSRFESSGLLSKHHVFDVKNTCKFCDAESILLQIYFTNNVHPRSYTVPKGISAGESFHFELYLTWPVQRVHAPRTNFGNCSDKKKLTIKGLVG